MMQNGRVVPQDKTIGPPAMARLRQQEVATIPELLRGPSKASFSFLERNISQQLATSEAMQTKPY
jgi:hypothetical protein